MTQKWTRLCDLLQPEVVGDVISGENVKTIKGYAVLNFVAANISNFRENQNQPFALRVDDDRPTWAPFSASRSKNV